jgi:hypothetical protein
MVVQIPSHIDFKGDIKKILTEQLLMAAQQIYYVNPEFSDALYFIYLVANDPRKENVVMVKNDIHQSNEFVSPYESYGIQRFWFNIEILIDLEQILGQMHVFACFVPRNTHMCMDIQVDDRGNPITPRKGGNWVFADSITMFGNNPILMGDINNYMADFGIEYQPVMVGGKKATKRKYGKKKKGVIKKKRKTPTKKKKVSKRKVSKKKVIRKKK